MPIPPAYFITFTCYGSRLHGDERGTVDRENRIVNTPYAPTNPVRHKSVRTRMNDDEFELDASSRAIALKAIRDVCGFKGWTLFAAHVRKQHFHLVVGAESPPEQVMHAGKAYATRALEAAGLEKLGRRWTRHGSTRYLWNQQSIIDAVNYVVREQGEPLAVYESEPRQ